MAETELVLWGAVLTDGQELAPSRVEVRGGRIVAVTQSTRPVHADVAVEDGWIAPGLIDLQVNGAGGVDLTSATDPEQALEHVARTLAKHGITAFCPTVVSAPAELIVNRLEAFSPRRIKHGAFGPRRIKHGAHVLGAHIEGPFINSEHRGVHEPRMLRHASHDEIDGWLSAGLPKIVTLAPELPGGIEAIEHLTRAGVVVSLGHSGASAAEAKAAMAAGASMGTHLFNGMSPFHHRRPGLVGALLASDAIVGLITDGIHLDRLTLDLVVRCAGPGRVVLVSDALAAAGAPAGPSALGDQALESDGRAVRRADGTLAGSAMLLDGCLRNARAWLPHVPAAAVLRMATQSPAQAVGERRKGRVVAGCDADLIVLDREWNVRTTLVGGEVIQPARMEVRS